MSSHRVAMSWPDLGISTYFDLDVEANPELTSEFWDALPFDTVQEHGAVTGKLIYCWVPIVSAAPVRVQNTHLAGPDGRVSYSQFTGNKVIIKFGPLTEDINAPVLGLVPAEELHKIAQVGETVWRSYHEDKRVIRVAFRKDEK
jgi:hypothetical protein